MTEEKDFRRLSQQSWSKATEGGPNIEELTFGCMLRIADALEGIKSLLSTMNFNYNALYRAQSEADRYRRLNNEKQKLIKTLRSKLEQQ